MAAGDMSAPLKAAIQSIQDQHKGRYGYRRVTATLRHDGQLVNSKKVRRLMGERGFNARYGPSGTSRTTA